MSSAAAAIELDDSDDGDAPAPRKALKSSPATDATVDLTEDTNDADLGPAPQRGSKREGKQRVHASQTHAKDDHAEASKGYVEIDLCGMSDDEGEEDGAGGSSSGGSFARGLARSLNMMFDDVEIVGERIVNGAGSSGASRGAGGGAGSAAALTSEVRKGSSGESVVTAIDVDAEVPDAELARRLQAQSEASAQELTGDELAAARVLQARLVQEPADGDAKRDVLRAERRRIRNWLATQANFLQITDVWANPEAEPGGALYDRFERAFLAATDRSVRLVFHGSPEANIGAICQHGLDPGRRGANGQALGTGEYFAEQPIISLPYCKGGSKMLVFAVLMDKSGLTESKQGIVVVHKSEHQLPMFVLTFDPKLDMRAALAAFAGRPPAAGSLAASIYQRLTSAAASYRAPPPPPPFRAPASRKRSR